MPPPRRRSSTVPPFLTQENWLDRAIGEARERGEFDDLPDHGKPIRLESNNLAPEWDLAFRVLKNAGFTPLWMALGKEIETATAELTAFLERTRRDLAERIAAAEARSRARSASTNGAREERHAVGRWRRFGRRQREPRRVFDAPAGPTWSELEASRLRARQQYLGMAAQLDAKIVEYHRELPDDLWRFQRHRQNPDVAARVFDAACPPIIDGGWSAVAPTGKDPPRDEE